MSVPGLTCSIFGNDSATVRFKYIGIEFSIPIILVMGKSSLTTIHNKWSISTLFHFHGLDAGKQVIPPVQLIPSKNKIVYTVWLF